MTTNDITYADELRVFERPVQDVAMFGASELLVDGAETDAVVLELARRLAGLGPVEYLRGVDQVREHEHESGALRATGVRRWVRNVAIAPAPRGFAYDAVNELWFDSVGEIAEHRAVIEHLLDALGEHSERGASTLLVAEVIRRIGRDRP
jgi:hypothetical protein